MQTVDRYFTSVALPGSEPVTGFVPLYEAPFVSPMFSLDLAKKILQDRQEKGGIKSWKYDSDKDVFTIVYHDGEKEAVSGEPVGEDYWFYKVGSEWPWKDVRR